MCKTNSVNAADTQWWLCQWLTDAWSYLATQSIDDDDADGDNDDDDDIDDDVVDDGNDDDDDDEGR